MSGLTMIAATRDQTQNATRQLQGALIRLITAAVMARLAGERAASPSLGERLCGLEVRALKYAGPQAVQILVSGRRLLGDHLERQPLTPADMRCERAV